MVTGVTDVMKGAAYRILVEELMPSTPNRKCPQSADPIVDAAAHYIIGLPNDWAVLIADVRKPLVPRTQERLAVVTTILESATESWDDLNDGGISASTARIDEVRSYVEVTHVPESLRD